MSDINVSDEFKESIQKFKVAIEQCTENFRGLFDAIDVLKENEIEKSIKIANLEVRKKHCKNYLELKQIDRELNSLKFRRRKK